MKLKSFMRLLLALVMVLSLTAFTPAALAEGALGDTDSQLSLIFSKLDELKQSDAQFKWYYSVTDLDHNGRLEFVAAAQHPADRSTNLKVWEVSTDGSALTEFTLNKDPEESFPDILTDTADTYHDAVNNAWYYLCYDNIILSATEVYTLKCGVSVKDSVVGYDSYAVEHTEVKNGFRNVSHTDTMGNIISPEQYSSAGTNALAGMERSSTSFDWFTAENATSLARLTDSYLVFSNQKAPTEVFPVPKPAALQDAAPTPTPAVTPSTVVTPIPTAAPAPQSTAPVFLTITKNPTNENDRKVGGKASFVACSNVFESLSWTMVSPDGGEYSVPGFLALFPNANISGEYSTTLTIGNVDANMNGWGAYCTFYYKGQVASTSTAWMYVGGSGPAPVVVAPPQSGSFNGYVADYSYSTITIYVYDGGGYTKDVGRDICVITGDLYVGAPVVAYYDGIGAHGAIFTYVSIQGSEPQPVVNYGSMSGIAYHDTAFTEYIQLANGTGVHIDGTLCNIVYGTYVDGCSCTVYYTDFPSEANIYQVDIYGDDEPSYDYSIVLDEDDADGGWAGSNYYENEAAFADDDGGGWAGSNYYENEAEYAVDDGGGWAGANYYENEEEFGENG